MTGEPCNCEQARDLAAEVKRLREALGSLKIAAIGACSALDRNGEPMVHLLRAAIEEARIK